MLFYLNFTKFGLCFHIHTGKTRSAVIFLLEKPRFGRSKRIDGCIRIHHENLKIKVAYYVANQIQRSKKRSDAINCAKISNQIFQYTRCNTPNLVMSSRGLSPRHCAIGCIVFDFFFKI